MKIPNGLSQRSQSFVKIESGQSWMSKYIYKSKIINEEWTYLRIIRCQISEKNNKSLEYSTNTW